MIIQIAAIANDNVLGRDNKMLWHLPKDFKRFKELTMGKPIVMGRKTFESLPGVLPGREHIVITTQSNYQVPEGVKTSNSLKAALDYAKSKSEDVYVIGGGEIYRQAMPFTDKLELTWVDIDVEGDTTYPDIWTNEFSKTCSEFHHQDEKHSADFEFATYVRIK